MQMRKSDEKKSFSNKEFVIIPSKDMAGSYKLQKLNEQMTPLFNQELDNMQILLNSLNEVPQTKTTEITKSKSEEKQDTP